LNRQTIRIGTRSSALALWQARWIVGQLQTLHPQARFTVVEVQTQGDRDREVPLYQVGSVGLFVKELEIALLKEEIDIAVHSLKDMPSQLPPGLTIAAVPKREDPRDALVSRLGLSLEELPQGARVGTGSRRRAAELLTARHDLRILNIRGNVDTRLRKAESEPYDAVVLAVAGLVRLGRVERITQILPPEIMLPAGGQGALAVEVRAGDRHAADLAARLDHPPTRHAVSAERAFLARLGGGCHAPVAAYAVEEDGHIRLRALASSPDGKTLVRGERRGPATHWEGLGRGLAEELLAQGAADLLRQLEEDIDN